MTQRLIQGNKQPLQSFQTSCAHFAGDSSGQPLRSPEARRGRRGRPGASGAPEGGPSAAAPREAAGAAGPREAGGVAADEVGDVARDGMA